jgi:hypothetical protein
MVSVKKSAVLVNKIEYQEYESDVLAVIEFPGCFIFDRVDCVDVVTKTEI